MTDNRERSEMFEAPLSEVLETIRAVLTNGQNGYQYENIIEGQEGREVNATIKPFRSGVLTAELSIRLYPFDAKTKVLVEIKSQKFKYGDVADFYGGYLRELFEMIHSRIGDGIGSMDPALPKKVKVPMKLWYVVNFGCIFILITKDYLIPLVFAKTSAGPVYYGDGLFFLPKVRMFVGFGTILFWITFNYWWQKKYFRSLDPKMQMAMDYGRKAGLRPAIWIAVMWLLFVAWFIFKH